MIHSPSVTRWIIFVVLVTFACGLFSSNDHESSGEKPDNISDHTLGPIHFTDYIQRIKLKPVTLAEFRRKIRLTHDRYDLLRIFFDRPELPEDFVDDLIDSGSLRADRNFRIEPKAEAVVDPEIQIHGDIQLPMDDDERFIMDGIEDVYDYYEELLNHPLSECRLPQPEILRVASYGGSGKIYYPECIIVHRCRNVTGCCEDEDEQCAPKSIEIFRRPFLVLELLKGDDNLVQPDRDMVEYLMMINHTECQCKKIPRLQECKKKCPVPFEIDPVQCSCYCKIESRRCRDVETGFLTLKQSQLICIKDNRCLLPKCRSGTFNVRTGFCPMTLDNDVFLQRPAVHPRFKTTIKIRKTSGTRGSIPSSHKTLDATQIYDKRKDTSKTSKKSTKVH